MELSTMTEAFEIESKRRNDDRVFYKNKTVKTRVKNVLYRRLPILEWLPKYNFETGVADFIAGVSLGLTMIPQSIAYASLANLSAEYGLYSSFMGTILYALFGTVKEVSIGPTSLMALLILQYTKNLPIDYVVLLGFLSGIVIILFGVMKLGFLIELISTPVTSGFTSATATVIIISQVKGILGIRFKAENFVDNFVQLCRKYGMVKWPDVVLGLSCIVFLLLLRKLKDAPIRMNFFIKAFWFISTGRNALIVFISAFIGYRLQLNGNVPFLLSDKISAGLPPFDLPKFSIIEGNRTVNFVEMCSTLGSGIFTVPFIAILANIAIAKAFTSNKKLDATQEMITLGICQIMGSFVQSMPTTGALSRSAVSHASGVRTPLAGIYTGVITLLALTFLTPYFYYIPRATLSAVLICAVVFMIDIQILKVMWRGNRWDVFITLITYIVSLLKGVEVGLLVGVLVNISYLLYMTARPSVEIRRCKSSTGCEYVLVTPEIGLYYLSISFLKDVIQKAGHVEGENVIPIVVDCSRFQGIDYSACKGLEDLTKEFEKRSQKLIFLNVSQKITAVLEPLTTINPSTYHCQCESEMLDALFATKGDETQKTETVPLLSDMFRKKESITSENYIHTVIETEIDVMKEDQDSDNKSHSTTNNNVYKFDKEKD